MDFFVLGAQKAGTTTLCSLLTAHPGVDFSSPKEPMFFCRDDERAHPYLAREPITFDWKRNRDALLADYRRRYQQDGRLRGDGSTTYLPSERAADRIAEVCEQPKLIVMLRDPVDRAYSAYWHMLRRWRVTQPFDEAVESDSEILLEFGRYKRHVKMWLQRFDRSRFLFLTFDALVADLQSTFDRVTDFLELERLDVSEIPREENRGGAPLSVGLQLWVNRTVQREGLSLLPAGMKKHAHDQRVSTWGRVVRELGRLNPKRKRYPPMNPNTRKRLREFYAKENEGLAALTGLPVVRDWWKSGPSAESSTRIAERPAGS